VFEAFYTSDSMNRKLEFFITERDATVEAFAKRKESDGSIFVGNAQGIIDQLTIRTEPDDSIVCRISGAWLDVCVEKSVRRLLNPVGYGNYLPGRTISAVSVDLATCVAWHDRELSIGEKRNLLTGKLGRLSADPRLTILP
jgi:hypothetical protein